VELLIRLPEEGARGSAKREEKEVARIAKKKNRRD